MRRLALFVSACLVLVGMFAAGANGESASAFPIKALKHQNLAPLDVPTNCVKGVTCDQAGICWFATWGGVYARSPYGEWTTFTTANSGLAQQYTHDVVVDSNNNVWITHHDSGVSLLNYNHTLTNHADDVWQHFTTTDGLGSNFMVSDVTLGPGGLKWFGHDSGLSRLNDNFTPFVKSDDSWTVFPGGQNGLMVGPIRTILFDQQNCTWAGGDFGISRICGGAWTQIKWPAGGTACPAGWTPFVSEMALDQWGYVWVVDGLCGAAVWTGLGWQVFDEGTSPMQDERLDSVMVDKHNNLWFGSAGGGVARLDAFGGWTIFRKGYTPWLKSDSVQGIAFDQAGHGWFASCGDVFGASEYIPSSLTSGFVYPSSGGEVISPDRLVRADFPPGAVASDVLVTLAGHGPAPVGDLLALRLFDLTAVISGTTTQVTTTNAPYEITAAYTPQEQGGAIESSIGLYYWDTGTQQWRNNGVSVEVNPATNIVTGTLTHLSLFGVLAETNWNFLPVVQR